MIIKLEDEKDKYNYLDLDEHLFDENSEDIYEDKSIYILHYPMCDTSIFLLDMDYKNQMNIILNIYVIQNIVLLDHQY